MEPVLRSHPCLLRKSTPGMQTGVLDAANTSSASFGLSPVEQAKCLHLRRGKALWFMYEPVLVSKRVFDGLTERAAEGDPRCGEKAEVYFNAERSARGDQL